MHKLVLATMLILSPAAAFGQSAVGTNGSSPRSSETAPQANGVYGPPAPTIDKNANVTAATPKAAEADSTQAPAKHGRHHRGGYAGVDSGFEH